MSQKVDTLRLYQNNVDILYRQNLGAGARFSTQTSLTSALLTDEEVEGFFSRYKLIRKFQQITSELFRRSLFDESLVEIRDLVLNEVNPAFGLDFHRALYSEKTDLPYFFRTDEPVPGKIGEIQCIASGWGIFAALQQSLAKLQAYTGNIPVRDFNQVPVAEKFASWVGGLMDDEPRVFYQADNSSDMLGMNYFMTETRKFGVKYLGRDSGVSFKNVNFVRSHSFIGQAVQIEFSNFLQRYHRGRLLFDLFPSVVFEGKLPLIFPFWEATRNLYPDEIREIFPFASLVSSRSVVLEDNEEVSIKEFASRKLRERQYYLKYAGADEQKNWGSKAVFNLGNASKPQCLELLMRAAEGATRREYWILQKAYHRREDIEYLDGSDPVTKNIYSKWSGFYGPEGFMGGVVFSRNHNKVHGQDETICRLML